MIRLSKHELFEMATLLVVANTPHSLFKGLLSSSAVTRLRYEEHPNTLLSYFNQITARAERSEIVMGLAYGVLIGLLMNSRNADWRFQPDSTRLTWGPQIEQHAKASAPPTQILNISAIPAPQVSTSNQSTSTLILPRGMQGN